MSFRTKGRPPISVTTQWRVLVQDLEASLRSSPHRPRWHWWIMVAAKTYALPRVRTLWCYRIGQLLIARHLDPLAWMLVRHAQKVAGAEIDPRAQIGPGIEIWHSAGIVIGPDAVIGRHVTLLHGITLGVGTRPGMPTIGDDVFIGANAVILGGVIIGDNVRIGANATVVTDIPAGAVVIGVKAQWRDPTSGGAARSDAYG